MSASRPRPQPLPAAVGAKDREADERGARRTRLQAHESGLGVHSDRSCIWGNNDYAWIIGERAPGGGLVNLSGEVNNQMDSWGNRTTVNSAGYDGANGGASCQTFSAGSRDNNVSFENSDEISSWKTNGGC